MYRLTFSGDEDLLDVVLPLLPGGVREDGDAYAAYSGAPFSDGGAASSPAAWSRRCRPTGSSARMGGGVVISGVVWHPLAVRSRDRRADRRRGRAARERVRVRLAPDDADVRRAAAASWSRAGASPTSAAASGTLAIVAAKLGWAPVVGVDRVPVAIEVARENVARNGVSVDVAVCRPRRRRRPARRRAAGQRAAARARARGRGGRCERPPRDRVRDRHRTRCRTSSRATRAGFEVAQGLGTEDEWIALRLSC